ncbi:phosphopantetheine adenylyltransferase [Lactobacillus acetotolerans]|jgi:pantetheine-phosphate adenylyltransferase|uniref:Phosphopantetheine adenylyltransferase n=1 Tax=Lactobacillus acetotolerans TaxID=1600 RepID=A0A0D6A1K0_9LACO|nr:pantetheine-phosphate adenylyltransferase [Lactobacillus acetotolerans]QJD72606.1 pantetheine-phosphate adenylyltransferase [Lactobacillus acetotolerans]BAQ56672.1 phosphopantetheine adenylyltransferase [Lactobacillus acetotolerans]
MKAIFPGSFDPITNGHLDIIKRAARIFDQVIIVISKNTHKNGLFLPTKRFELVKGAVKQFENVEVKLVQTDLTINLVHKFHADVIIRGARNEQDFVYEQQIALMNRQMDPEVETIILFASPDCSYISSSLIREIASFRGKVANVVPENVNQALIQKMNSN